MNKSFTWFAVPTILLIVVLASFIVLRQYNNQQQANIVQEKLANFSQKCNFLDKSNWTTFNDPEDIFSVKYSDCWTEGHDTSWPSINYFFTRNDVRPAGGYHVANYQPPLSVPYFTISGGSSLPLETSKLVSESQITVDGNPAIKKVFAYDQKTCEREFQDIISKIDSKFCEKQMENTITVTLNKEFLDSSNQRHYGLTLSVVYDSNENFDYNALFDQMLETLKFK